MSFNIQTRLNDLEALSTSSLSAKANRVEPILISPVLIQDSNNTIISNFDSDAIILNKPVSIKDISNNIISNFDSTSIILNKPLICNSSVSAPISLQQK